MAEERGPEYAVGLVPATAEPPSNSFVTALLTDMYQISMAYAYFKAGKADDYSTFDMFFRKPPFGGEFTIFAGLEECLRYVQSFRFTDAEISYLQTLMPTADPAFWSYLRAVDCSEVKLYAVAEGTVVFPREPLLRVEGPLAVCQLLETTLLNLCNFASLVCTNAARHRLAAGPGKTLLEFGLRRAQGPDGAMSASRYSAIGGFDGTSNVLAGMAYGLAPKGTHAHALVSAFVGLDDLPHRMVDGVDVVELALGYRRELGYELASLGELAAFVAFAQAFPDNFLALVDTYDTLSSGLPNFICVALALVKVGRAPVGIRLDSGDLAYLSRECRRVLRSVDTRYGTSLAACRIVASNDINEAVLLSLNEQKHEIDVFGIGTNLVTCQAQPALGMVYKLVEIGGTPRIKLSQEASKITLPARKEVYRLIGGEGVPILDLIIRAGEPRPQPGRRVLCRHPFDEKKRAYVTPTAVIPLLRLVWKGGRAGLDEALATDEEFLSSAAAEAVEGAGTAAAHGVAATAPAAGSAAAAGSPGAPSAVPSPPLSPSGVRSIALAKPHLPPTSSVGLIPVPRVRGESEASVGAGLALHLPEPALPVPSAAAAAPASHASTGAAAGAGAAPGFLSPSALPSGVNLRAPFPPLPELRRFVSAQLQLIREDHLRPLNATPYKVSVSTELFHFMHELILREVPIPELE